MNQKRMKKSKIIKKAKKFCKKNNITEYPVPIVRICEAYGFKVFEQYLPDAISGFIVAQEEPFYYYNSNRVIVVNLSDSASKRRFTIAHELANFLLHKKQNTSIYAHIQKNN